MGDARSVAIFTMFDDEGNGGDWISSRDSFIVELHSMEQGEPGHPKARLSE